MVLLATRATVSTWKDASRTIPGADNSVLVYAKCIADEDAAAAQVTAATVAVAGDVITVQVNAANDAGIAYTGQSGAAGTITYTDGNADSVQEVVNVFNGVGVGQTAFRRWRAAIGDFHPGYALTAADVLAVGATNALTGRLDNGVDLFADSSALASANQLNVGIGTSGGTIEGSGWLSPDYFEDIPGSSTTASVNTPIRGGVIRSRKSEDAVTRRKQFRIVGFSASAQFATTQVLTIRDIDGTIVWTESLTAGAVTAFQDRTDAPIVGPLGSPLFCELTGTGAFTDGFFSIKAEEQWV